MMYTTFMMSKPLEDITTSKTLYIQDRNPETIDEDGVM